MPDSPPGTTRVPEPDRRADPPVVRMANDIARQFGYLPADEAAAAVANHLRSFWDPRMRRQLAEEVGRDPDRLDPAVVRALTTSP